MNSSERRARLQSDFDLLRRLAAASSIFKLQCHGELPDRYTIEFHGRGLASEPRPGEPIAWTDVHRIDLRLPFSYPEGPPDIRWQTPLFHPNVSFSGFINLTDIGLDWDEETDDADGERRGRLSLEVVCERLWDVARLAYVDLDGATNYTARAFFDDDHQLNLPVDPRPLRSHEAENRSNVIRYERRDSKVESHEAGFELLDDEPEFTENSLAQSDSVALAESFAVDEASEADEIAGNTVSAEIVAPEEPVVTAVEVKAVDGGPSSTANDIYFIGPDTPVPDLPQTKRRRRSEDGDILYIGDE